MRQFAWYCPEYNWIVFQIIMDDCYICFEWDIYDISLASIIYGEDCSDLMGQMNWIPLGEL